MSRAERYAPQRLPAAEKHPHAFDGDPDQGKDYRGNFHRCTCGMPEGNRIHNGQAIADHEAQLRDAQAEARRRLGEVD